MINLSFESSALPADTFQILKFDGEEAVSQLFRFELQLVSRDPDIDFDAVLEASAKLAITTQDNTRYLHGMLSEFEQCGEWQNGLYEYRAVVVPRLWIMAQSTQNQIFQGLTVPDIIESELDSIQAKGSHPLVTSGLSVDDYELYMTRNYKEREYTVQYKETDLNFISRLMEHEGIYYYFEHDENREKLVITDTMATEEIAGDSYTEFMTESATARYDRNVVYKLNRAQKQVPDSILVKDFNYRSPSLPMQADSAVVDNGIGFVTEFGAHFKEPEDGEVLASIRAEEYRCRQNMYSGESNVAAFSCGGLYSLGQHFRREYNQTYMITRVRHSGSQEIESWGKAGSTHYHNQFECIPSGLSYRPQRLTPKPKLYGIMNGTIDSELDTGRADLDEYGRYKVMMPFDISGTAPGMASRRIRMAQPYGGGGAGMSFPLVKGTEVIWTCIDGDIDRPIITGAVPNPLNPSVTTAENNTSNVIKTTSGITMGFHDGSGGGGQNSTGGGAGGGLAAQQQFQNVDSGGDSREENQFATRPGTDANQNLTVLDATSLYSIALQQQYQSGLSLSPSWQAGQDIEETDTNFQIYVPYDTTSGSEKNSYLRMGLKANSEAITDVDIESSTGWVDYTDGDRVSVTQGKKIEHINGGDYDLVIADGDLETANAGHMHSSEFRKVGWFGGMPVWRKTVLDHTCSDSYSFGDSESFFGGFTFDGFVGLSTEVKLGGSLGLGVAAEVDAFAGSKISFALGPEISYSFGGVDSEGTTNEMTGNVSTRVNVKPSINGVTTGGAVTTGVGSAATIVTTAIAAGLAAGTQTGETGSAVGAGIGMGLATALTTGLTAAALADKASKMAEPSVAELFMAGTTPASGKLRLGMGPGELLSTFATPGIDITPYKISIGFGPSNCLEITPQGMKIVTPSLDSTTINDFKVTSGAILDLTSTGALNLKAGATMDQKSTGPMSFAAPTYPYT